LKQLPILLAFLTACIISSSSLHNAEVTLSLLHEITSASDGHAEAYSSDPMTEAEGLHLVVSHCSQPLDWIFKQYLASIHFKSVTIITKCGTPPFSEVDIQLPEEPVSILSVPNVGRCDHSYALWIKRMLEDRKEGEVNTTVGSSLYLPNDQVLFMKDNDNKYRSKKGWESLRSLSQMRNQTSQRGFSCGSRVLNFNNSLVRDGGLASNYADRQTLGMFRIDEYKTPSRTTNNDPPPFQARTRPLSSWTESLPISVSYTKKGVMEVCFGGVFMTTVQRIMDAPVGNWSAIIEALSRGDNIEEGHFMERLWAGLLAPPVGKEKERRLLAEKTLIFRKEGYLGVIFLKRDSHILDDEQ
jgi:hypothetical protein